MSRHQASGAAQKSDCHVVAKHMLFDEDKNVSSFIGKLSLMLQDPSAHPFVSWSPTGESIVIIDPPRFSSQILPRYFKHSNFASFVRQLNLYGFHKTSQESESCEFSHPVFRQGNEHIFKDIRRKVATQSSQERDGFKSKSEMEKMMQSIDELRARQSEFESALKQKEAEKMLIYQEMIQSKHRQDVLEARMARMLGVLMQACHSIGLTQIEGDGGNLLQIMDADSDKFRFPKRQRLIENAADAGERSADDARFGQSSDLISSWNSDMATNDLLDALSAKLSSVSANRDKLRPKFEGPTFVDVTDSMASEALENPLDNFESGSGSSGECSNYAFPTTSPQNAGDSSVFGSSADGAQVSPMLSRMMAASNPSQPPTSPHCAQGEIDSVSINSSLLLSSPRAFEGYDGLASENLNSIELSLDSQTLNLDTLLGGESSPASAKRVRSPGR